MTPEEMDKVFAAHCAAEAANDLVALMDTLSDEIEHDVVGDPMGILRDRDMISRRYSDLFEVLEQERMDSLHRYHGDGFLVDDALFVAKVVGDFMGLPGGNRRISFRILHVCEFRDGKISRENVWLDSAAVMQQLMAPEAKVDQ